MHMVLVDNALYIQLPQQERGQMGGKPWVKISADGDDPMSKMLGSMLTTVSDNVDVTKQIDQIKNAGTITKSAQENLDGQQVVHYWIDVDVQKLAALQKEELTKTALESLAKQGTKTLKYELWVRGDGLPAKFTTQMPVGAGQPVSVTVGFTDWGKPVSVQAPPADLVGEMPKMGGCFPVQTAKAGVPTGRPLCYVSGSTAGTGHPGRPRRSGPCTGPAKSVRWPVDRPIVAPTLRPPACQVVRTSGGATCLHARPASPRASAAAPGRRHRRHRRPFRLVRRDRPRPRRR